MKKLHGLLFVGALLLAGGAGIASSFHKDMVAYAAWTGAGTGSASDPYQISTLAEFNTFRNIVNGTGGEDMDTSVCAILKADIDLENNDSNQTVQLGSEANPYNGTFDGDGHSITNLYISKGSDDSSYGGLFAYTGQDAVLKDFSISGYVKCHKPAGVVGCNKADITNVTNNVNTLASNLNDFAYSRSGGIAAESYFGDITYCTNNGTITSYYYAGGIVGYARSSDYLYTHTIEKCINNGHIARAPNYASEPANTDYIGGIVGKAQNTVIKDSINYGLVEGGYRIGGIVGEHSSTYKPTVARCLNVGLVSGLDADGECIGGIVGNIAVGNTIYANASDENKIYYYNYYLENSVYNRIDDSYMNDSGFGQTNNLDSMNPKSGHHDVINQCQVLTPSKMKVKSNLKNWEFGDFIEMGKDYPVKPEVAIEQDIDIINSIGTVEYTDECKQKLDDASRIYDGLTEAHKAAITNHNVLVAALEQYAVLEAEHKAAEDVIDLINSIGEVKYSITSKNKIDAARAAYDALTTTQKSYIDETTYKVLTDAEATYAELKAKFEKVEAVIALIEDIGPVEYTDASKAKIDVARAGYDALTDSQKITVGALTYKVLTDAEETYASLKVDHTAADPVIVLINEIGEVRYNESTKVKIDEARDAYDALTPKQKQLVDNYELLEEAEVKYEELENAPRLPGWAIALIVIGGVLLLAILALLVLFIFFARYVIDDSKKVVIRTIYIRNKNGAVLLLDTRLRRITRQEEDVYKSKEEAEKALNK